MKKIVLILVLILIANSGFSQNLAEFYMPQIQSKEDCAKYIGKKVCVFDYSTNSRRWKDSYKLDAYRTRTEFYIIKKIKFGGQIVLTLDNGSYTEKVKVNNGGPVQYDELSSCDIFFLWDDFEEYKKGLIGTTFQNKQGEDVAVLKDIELLFRIDEDPIMVSTLTSKINNEEFICFTHDAYSLCQEIGTIVSNPKVKHSYRILSVNNKMPTDGKYKYIYADNPRYTYENIETGKIGTCSAKSIQTEPFEEDLSGKYISLLAEVEKPANSDIRYGETMIVPSEDGISKFTYKDNVIDIMIFADRSNFNFTLQNVSESSIKIVWDEAVFVNFDGSTEKVMHKGIKFSEKNGSQPATTIIKKAKWEDSVTPTHLVYYREATKYIEGGWTTSSMYPIEKGLTPGQIRLMLPIQIKDVINEYVFVFDVRYVYNHPERLNLEN